MGKQNMTLEVKLRIANGCGDAVMGPMKKKIPSGLVSGGQGCIQMNGSMKDEFPNNGWTGFDWILKVPISIDIDKLFDKNHPVAKDSMFRDIADWGINNFVNKRQEVINKLKEKISNEIESAIKGKESALSVFSKEGAWVTLTGGSASVEHVKCQ